LSQNPCPNEFSILFDVKLRVFTYFKDNLLMISLHSKIVSYEDQL
jgi:hypothetical protein